MLLAVLDLSLPQVSLLEFMRDNMMVYLDHADKNIRRSAALACCRVLERHAQAAYRRLHGPQSYAAAAAVGYPNTPGAGGGGGMTMEAAAAAAGLISPGGASPGGGVVFSGGVMGDGAMGYGQPGLVSPQAYGVGGYGAGGGAGAEMPLFTVRQTQVVEQVVSKLLTAAVADTSEGVRRDVLKALHSTRCLDTYLSQADCLHPLFVALNDESAAVRATAIRFAGRLSMRNSAYVYPALRRHLLQLLVDMEHSPDSKQREESAYLLNCLIDEAPKLIMPYVSPIQKVRGVGLR